MKRYFCNICNSEFKPNAYISINLNSNANPIYIRLADRGDSNKYFEDALCNECIKKQIPDNRIEKGEQ